MTTTTRNDAPGRVIPILEQEFEDFRTEATAFLEGQRAEDKFIGFRLKQGVYGQRQPERQMIRVKLPFGAVTADQLDAFAVVAEEYAPLRKGHITTRQNYQFHHIPLRRMIEAGAPREDRAVQPGGVRQHRPQRDGRPVRGRA
jgi:sulfite reductase (ferredoxin)